MAVAKMKEVVGRKIRVADSKCAPGGVKIEVDVGGGHTVITDEPAERGGTVVEETGRGMVMQAKQIIDLHQALAA